MAKITRVYQKQFGSQGPAGDFGVFGSKANPPMSFSQDPTAIQSLQAFLYGWGASIIGNYEPPLEDMNSLFLLAFRQLCYIFQQGVAEYDASTTYFIGSFVSSGSLLYVSLVDNNSGNTPASSPSSWQQYPVVSSITTIQPLTNDPASPAQGQTWLRVDY